jgi:hypothetical protein
MQTMGSVMPPLHGHVFAWLSERDITPAGPPFWKYNVIDMDRPASNPASVARIQSRPDEPGVQLEHANGG